MCGELYGIEQYTRKVQKFHRSKRVLDQILSHRPVNTELLIIILIYVLLLILLLILLKTPVNIRAMLLIYVLSRILWVLLLLLVLLITPFPLMLNPHFLLFC